MAMSTPTRPTLSPCCARAASGQAAAAPPRSVMNSRRFMLSISRPLLSCHHAVSPPCHRLSITVSPAWNKASSEGLNDECLPRARRQPEGLSAVTLQEEERPLTDAELEMLFSSVPWRDPIRISDFGGNFGFACRFCIARYGIRDGDIPSLSMSAREVRRHIRAHHPWSVGGDKRIRRRRKR